MPLYRTLPSQVFSIFFNCKRPQKSDHQQQCSEADYFLLWKKGMPSTGRVQILQSRDTLDNVTFIPQLNMGKNSH